MITVAFYSCLDGLPAQPFRLDLTDHTAPVESAEPVTPDGTAD